MSVNYAKTTRKVDKLNYIFTCIMSWWFSHIQDFTRCHARQITIDAINVPSTNVSKNVSEIELHVTKAKLKIRNSCHRKYNLLSWKCHANEWPNVYFMWRNNIDEYPRPVVTILWSIWLHSLQRFMQIMTEKFESQMQENNKNEKRKGHTRNQNA